MGFSWDVDKGKWLEFFDWFCDYVIDIGIVLNSLIMIYNDSYLFIKGKVKMMCIRE